MLERTVGYVVVERNQASGTVEHLNSDQLFALDELEIAGEQAEDATAEMKRLGRGEQYLVARVVLDELV